VRLSLGNSKMNQPGRSVIFICAAKFDHLHDEHCRADATPENASTKKRKRIHTPDKVPNFPHVVSPYFAQKILYLSPQKIPEHLYLSPSKNRILNQTQEKV
jgi:hypothetical protein